MKKEDVKKVIGMYFESIAETLAKGSKKNIIDAYLDLFLKTVDLNDPDVLIKMIKQLLEEERKVKEAAEKGVETQQPPPNLIVGDELDQVYRDMRLSSVKNFNRLSDDLAKIGLTCMTRKWAGPNTLAVSEDTMTLADNFIDQLSNAKVFDSELPLVRPLPEGSLSFIWSSLGSTVRVNINYPYVEYLLDTGVSDKLVAEDCQLTENSFNKVLSLISGLSGGIQ